MNRRMRRNNQVILNSEHKYNLHQRGMGTKMDVENEGYTQNSRSFGREITNFPSYNVFANYYNHLRPFSQAERTRTEC